MAVTVALSALVDWLRARFKRPKPKITDAAWQDYLDACDAVGWPT